MSEISSRRVWGKKPGQLYILYIIYRVRRKNEIKNATIYKSFMVAMMFVLGLFILSGCGSTADKNMGSGTKEKTRSR